MSIERITQNEEIKKGLVNTVVKSIGEYFEKDSDTTVSEAQMEAYGKVVEALPEGRLKDLAENLKGVQGVSSKFNQIMLGIQDRTWRLAKPIVVLKAPVVGAIPSEPFSKVAIKAAQLGSILGVKVITESLSLNQKIKERIARFRLKKQNEETE